MPFNVELPTTKFEMNRIQHKINGIKLFHGLDIRLNAGINDKHYEAYVLMGMTYNKHKHK